MTQPAPVPPPPDSERHRPPLGLPSRSPLRGREPALLAILVWIVAACAGPSTPPPGGDGEAPTVTITSPATTATPAYTLTAEASDDRAVTALRYAVGGGPPQDFTPATGPLRVDLVLPFGATELTVSAEDAAGNSGEDAITVVYDPDAEPREAGALTVTVAGLPAGTDADITVRRPERYVQDVTGTATLDDLEPGDYTVEARTVDVGGTPYVADPPQRSVTVAADATATAEVSYHRQNPELGSLAVTVAGIPAGAADVTVTGPLGYARTLEASATLLELVPGDYTVTAADVTADGTPYEAAPDTQTIAVGAGATSDATVVYSGPETGTLEVEVRELPTGAAADITVTNDAGTSTAVTASTLLRDLAPGDYVVRADDITVGGERYIPNRREQTVTVEAGATALAVVGYAPAGPDIGSLRVVVEGLREGVAADVTVRSSDSGVVERVGGSTVLDNLPAGEYTIVAAPVKPDSATFAPDEAERTVEVVAFATAEATVGHACGQVDPPDPILERVLRDALGIPSGAIDCSDLETLTGFSAYGEGISDVEGLQYASNLETLTLTDNKISSLPDGFFSLLTALEEIELGENSLAELPGDVFEGPTGLRYLYLYDNRLASLPKGIFGGLTALASLELGGNAIASLPENIFDGLAELDTLNLSDNLLADLPAGVLDDLTNLGLLDLGYNLLADLPTGVFDGPTDLYLLDLTANRFGRLPAGAFAGLSGVRILSLRGNLLTDLPARAFDGLSDLETLYLSDNQLRHLTPTWFADLPALEDADLGNNCLDPDQVPTRGVIESLRLGGGTVTTTSNPRSDRPCPPTPPPSAGSSFDLDVERWTADGGRVGWDPGGHLTARGPGKGDVWNAPPLYLGDATAYHGRTLGFALYAAGTGAPLAGPDVILEGGGTTLSYTLPRAAGPNWTDVEVALVEGAGWTANGGGAATEQQILDVLADLTALRIRWRHFGSDAVGVLDDVAFGTK